MHNTPEDLVRLLRHHPSPALSVEEARNLVAESDPGSRPPEPDAFASMTMRDPQLRLLALTNRRWAGAGPSSWILLRTPGGPGSSRSILGRLRESLRRLGEELEPGSTLALARWERMLREERKVRLVLRRRLPGERVSAGR